MITYLYCTSHCIILYSTEKGICYQGQELWKGGISHWSGTKIFSFLAMLSVVPPLWVVFSLPLDNKYNKTPIVKFGCHLTSHIFFMTFQILTSCMPIYPIYGRTSLFPFWNEWVVVFWLAGLLLGEVTSPGDRTGLGVIKIVIIILNLIAFGIHISAIFADDLYWPVLVYIRNIFGGFSFLCCCIQILDFLSFHHLFGPWAIIISSLIIDTGKFLTVLMLFEVGFSMLIIAMNQAYHAQAQLSEDINKILDLNEGYHPNPLDALERLFFALFGLTTVQDLKMSEHIEDWTLELFKFVYAIYLLTTSIVLINLLIAMMSDTYQRIQQDSDTEWKFGLAKLIRNMHRTNASPAPINLITTWTTMIGTYCKKKRKMDNYKRMKQEESKLGTAKRKGKVSPFTDVASTTEAGGHTAAGSMSSVRSKNFLENSVDWAPVVKKYRSLIESSPDD